jgi:hypothetical protein
VLCGQSSTVYTAAPRVERDLLVAIARLDDASLPIAETYRRSREVAERLGIPRPSYELVRQHVKAVRRRRDLNRMKRDILIDFALHHRSAPALNELFE